MWGDGLRRLLAREDVDLAGHAGYLLDGGQMELRGERVGVEEEQVRAEGEVERAVGEAEVGSASVR
jgi:hypothetical protein